LKNKKNITKKANKISQKILIFVSLTISSFYVILLEKTNKNTPGAGANRDVFEV